MPPISRSGSDLVGFHVDTELLVARMRNMKAEMRDLTGVYREAVKPIYASYILTMPKGGKGSRGPSMRRDAYKSVSYAAGVVGLRNTGRLADPTHHSGVTEFGGTIPVPHSKTNPALRGQRRMLSKHKPWIGGRGGTSYYLYPMWEKRWPEVLPPFVDKLKSLCRKYMPSGTVY